MRATSCKWYRNNNMHHCRLQWMMIMTCASDEIALFVVGKHHQHYLICTIFNLRPQAKA